MSTTHPRPRGTPLPLALGQRLDRATFHTLYEATPPGMKAELIGGVVYMPSPVGYRHSLINVAVIEWLCHYRQATPGVQVLTDATTALDDLGEPQPDAQLRVLPDHGGRTRNE